MSTLQTKIQNDGRSFFDFYIPSELKVNIFHSTLGFIIYFLICIIFIPYLIIKNKNYDLLEAYLPNVDLVANIISYRGGPLGNNLFRELYMPSPLNISSFLQQTFINYFALLGVTYIIARETYITKSISHGWSIGIIMLLITYLLPSHFIVNIMNNLYSKLNIHNNTHSHKFFYSAYIPSVLLGSIITILIIYFEKQLILFTRKNLIKIADFIIKLPANI